MTITSVKRRTGQTLAPGTSPASWAFSTGTTTSGFPPRTAASAAGSTPRTGRTLPSGAIVDEVRGFLGGRNREVEPRAGLGQPGW